MVPATDPSRREWDVVVVGGGPAGILVSDVLRRHRLDVLLIEAGPTYPGLPADVRADDRVWPFQTRGARGEWRRVYGLGGRTLIWGGWMERFASYVFDEGAWPYGPKTLRSSYRAVEAWSGVSEGTLSNRHRPLSSVLGVPVVPKRAAVRRGAVFRADHKASARTAMTQMVATKLEMSGRHAREVRVVDSSGDPLTISGKAFILAASPVETSRLLMASGIDHPEIGKNLTDHFTESVAVIERHATPARGEGPLSDSAFIPRFVNLGVQSRRPYRGGFCLEIVGPRAPRELSELTRRMLDVSADEEASVTLVLGLGEQFPYAKRYVDLATGARDALGRAVPRIHFAWSRSERRLFHEMRNACFAVGNRLASGNGRIVELHNGLESPLLFHPAGTCRMGNDEAAPCDRWGRLRSFANVWIADASVFPSSGDRHPTLTVLAHAERVARRVATLRWN
jgi:choline dehydrogenase-like flavoprotein